jgi:hypothetical protein
LLWKCKQVDAISRTRASFHEPDAIAPLEPTRCVTWTGYGKGTTPSAIEFGLNQVTVSKLREQKYLIISQRFPRLLR